VKISYETDRSRHDNAFGFLRLLFASLVIASHVPQQATGDHSLEPLHRMFGTISIGTFAVYGFFIISGYLICGSAMNSRSFVGYLAKRVGRIYPAFIVASVISMLVVAPLAGAATPDAHEIVLFFVHVAALQPPEVDDAFRGTFYPALNGSMWTISYEFRCYILMLLLVVTGVVRRRWVMPLLAFVLLVIAASLPQEVYDRFDAGAWHPGLFVGRLRDALIFTGLFLAGTTFYLFRSAIRMTHIGAVIALVLLVAGLFFRPIAALAVAAAGAYLIFYAAQFGARTWLKSVNDETDISYGLYLYAWPIGKLIAWYAPDLNLVAVMILNLALACAFGFVSWYLIERPAIALFKRFDR
jgi:peptidoglycan/LPS O-acetylase OafA/YrhL